ncbi:DNA-protecting protein DprA [Mucilaginibacter limnophilus]|uniref:DNA-protecting protein DprA n=1 Tax=Mucilaginibacter limnophilus TaxID=1932778 RepID=A0A437MKC8_9SPHI|nr:DNA-processing protein DprA [Mucilaginibacter limnophilus]RVT98083.1 DNA-protecting protein DprA [Mucilaginibacter limnophilus]
MSLLHQIALSLVKNIGPVTARALITYFDDAEKIFNASPSRLMQVPGIGEKTVKSLNFDAALKRAEQEVKFVEKNNIDVLFYSDSRYPKRLKNCVDAPILLYSRGNADLNNRHVISIVGTRNATDYGRQLCKQLVEDLQQYGVLIVSGLAHGIDVAAHKEALRLNLPTVGVLGHGLDTFYPAANRSTAQKMLENGGLLTEYASETKADRENFPARNRIVAGMADATVVIEASIKGGALITAEIANSYNRDVFAFPGRLGDEFSEGCNFLIRHNKAMLLTCAADLAYSLGWEKPGDAKPREQMLLPIDLEPAERLVFDIMLQHKSPLSIDELTIKTNMPMSQLAMALLNLEMHGYVTSLPGKTYRLS